MFDPKFNRAFFTGFKIFKFGRVFLSTEKCYSLNLFTGPFWYIDNSFEPFKYPGLHFLNLASSDYKGSVKLDYVNNIT